MNTHSVASDIAVLYQFGMGKKALLCPSVESGPGEGDESPGLNKLPMPLAETPGCMPRKGTSRLIVPRILWTKCEVSPALSGLFKHTSMFKIPPMLCPSKMTSVSGDS